MKLRKVGSGRLVVLLHTALLDGRFWEEVVASLAFAQDR
jgi:hypothetical protein